MAGRRSYQRGSTSFSPGADGKKGCSESVPQLHARWVLRMRQGFHRASFPSENPAGILKDGSWGRKSYASVNSSSVHHTRVLVGHLMTLQSVHEAFVILSQSMGGTISYPGENTGAFDTLWFQPRSFSNPEQICSVLSS